jgi:hypothetical protein
MRNGNPGCECQKYNRASQRDGRSEQGEPEW